jgi:hypothetical protein
MTGFPLLSPLSAPVIIQLMLTVDYQMFLYLHIVLGKKGGVGR